jgi:hypothetical protein
MLGGAASRSPIASRFGENIRLSSDLANPLSKSQHQRADGDGCVGLHVMGGLNTAERHRSVRRQ